MILWMFVFVVLASLCKAIKDTLSFHFDTSKFKNLNQKYWNPAISWKNKYKEDLKTPKFFGSTTIFVFITDAWHLFDLLGTLFLFLVPFFAVSATIGCWVVYLLIFLAFVVYLVIFELLFSFVL